MFGLKRAVPQPVVETPVAVATPVACEPSVHCVQGEASPTGLKAAIHGRLIEDYGRLFARVSESEALSPEAIAWVRKQVQEMAESRDELLPRVRLEQLVNEILAEIRGLGPLEPLLEDPLISEIMVNSPQQVFVERQGRVVLTDVRFDGDEHVLRVIDRIVSRVGRHVDEASPMVDARLPDGSRVNAIIPPLALNGPCLTIRRFRKDPMRIEELIQKGSLTGGMADFLRACVQARLNTIISGGTGSGKTTILNVLSSFIPTGERLITIEDAAELQLQQPHVVRLETRQANSEGVGAVHQGDLLRNTLRMRPDRIIIGEIRGGEALTMLQAMNTGHEGSMTTVHSNTCRDALSRLETMVLMSGMELPHRAIREQIASSLDLVVQIERAADGTRRVTQISEIVGMEGDVYLLQDIFKYVVTGRNADGKLIGRHVPTGIVPRAMQRLEAKGIPLSVSIFQAEGGAR